MSNAHIYIYSNETYNKAKIITKRNTCKVSVVKVRDTHTQTGKRSKTNKKREGPSRDD
jgi:hypothetical protein